MLEEVRRNLETEGLKAELHQMDVQSLEFADNSFDAVVSRNVFWNLEHADKAYEEAYRVLKKRWNSNSGRWKLLSPFF